MNRWNNVKKQNNTAGEFIRRLPEVSGISTIGGDSVGNDMVPERGSSSTGSDSEKRNQPIQRDASSNSQFVNNRCQYCQHYQAMHFVDTDSMGYWSFCMYETCDCFLDERIENAT